MISKTRSLITGVNGFAGSHLAELLIKKNHKVYGISNDLSFTQNISTIKTRLKLFETDLRDKQALLEVIKKVKPDYIFHLAAQSFAPTTVRNPEETFDINFIGTYNLLEAVRRADLNSVIQIACSSEEYGFVYPSEIPIKETNPLRPLNPYAISKIAADFLGYQYFKSYGLKIIRTRAFNHEGPRRGEMFAISSFAKQITMIEKGLQKPVIRVGNLKGKRDFTDVRDMVRAYHLSVQKCEPGEVYNICSGKAWSIREVLEHLLSMTKVKNIEIKRDPKRIRAFDLPILLGDNAKFIKATGWRPKIGLDKTLTDTLKYWRGRLT